MANDVVVNVGTSTNTKTVASDDVGGTQFQKIKLDVGAAGASSPFTGTVKEITNIAGGTLGIVGGGSMVVTAGTVSAGSVTNLATLGTLQNLNQGTITKLEGGTVNVVAAGSFVQTAGTTNVTTGSIVTTAGTLTTGTLQNLVSGTVTVGVGTIVNLNQGTITKLEGGTLGILTNGSIVQTAGTVTTGSLSNIATAGTLTALNRRAPQVVTTFGTLGTAGGSFFGTISSASGAGTVHMISGLSIISVTGTPDVRLLIGSGITGGSVLQMGALVAGAGIQKTFEPPIESGTNSELIYHFVGAGTAAITMQYWKV